MSSSTLPSSAWDDLARAATSLGDDAEAEILSEFLAFPLGADRYALPVERVREIVRLRQITPVPRVPRKILGIISLRGEIVQVLDLAQRLGGVPNRPTPTTRIVVLHGDEGNAAGLLVEGVASVLRVPEDAFREAPGSDTDFVSRLCEDDGEFVSILNLERVLNLVE
ncbi:MAG: purine-binding chemotaxis protein CheW [Deltaproteobacteria bacterium]|nr:purine-binding chemotaxis protein CheW [Deltaproteobacteria bacterium]MBW2392991.1 purine-binding chemotaxis protein CheW [Deltaproteobacteria bacterium]